MSRDTSAVVALTVSTAQSWDISANLKANFSLPPVSLWRGSATAPAGRAAPQLRWPRGGAWGSAALSPPRSSACKAAARDQGREAVAPASAWLCEFQFAARQTAADNRLNMLEATHKYPHKSKLRNVAVAATATPHHGTLCNVLLAPVASKVPAPWDSEALQIVPGWAERPQRGRPTWLVLRHLEAGVRRG
eukprot:CAMPEP_0175191320 /NCGR_PEP_ID=MMETSP0093-20121207/4885_1 /TAXON_ID=311494 /ORGANISM="Alexandrium monilatum, Strain CCMP3105" /LENGTH=190 /DNA_ID=CAMNT_0016484147 /DNA_START=217 /DNA_END=791 /DNA_ORIENTATION=-